MWVHIWKGVQVFSFMQPWALPKHMLDHSQLTGRAQWGNLQRIMLLILANFSLFWFSQPWTLPASIYSLTVCSQNELSPSSSKDKPLFPHQSLTLILWLCRALTQTEVHSEMSTPVHALKFHIWLFHTESAEFLHVSLPSPLRAGSPSSLVCRAQLKQWHGDFAFNAQTLLPLLY